jgi:argininosuccinate synthase
MLETLLSRPGADVVTLTVDVGQGGDLQQVRDRALAAGAARAHVIDAREEFARLYALPALRAGVVPGAWRSLVRSLGVPLIEAKLQEIAAIENATLPPGVPPEAEATLLGRVVEDGRYLLTRSSAAASDSPAVVEIAFDRGVPIAINDVAMPLVELIESLALIAGQHGVGRVEDVEAPAAVILHAGLQAGPHATVRLKLLKGSCEPVAELVAQS